MKTTWAAGQAVHLDLGNVARRGRPRVRGRAGQQHVSRIKGRWLDVNGGNDLRVS
jgi:hypothetical protein